MNPLKHPVRLPSIFLANRSWLLHFMYCTWCKEVHRWNKRCLRSCYRVPPIRWAHNTNKLLLNGHFKLNLLTIWRLLPCYLNIKAVRAFGLSVADYLSCCILRFQHNVFGLRFQWHIIIINTDELLRDHRRRAFNVDNK